MPTYSSSGEENLRANASVKYNAGKDSPSGKGSSVGGTENRRADQQTKQASFKETPGGGKDSRPAGVQNFAGMAKEGGR